MKIQNDSLRYIRLVKQWKRRKAFKLRLYEKYGSTILKDFGDLQWKHFWNLTDIANKYGFSRERARQMYKKLFVLPYIDAKKAKTQDRREQERAMNRSCDPRQKINYYKNGSWAAQGAKSELLVLERLSDLGFDVQLDKDSTYDMAVNGYKIDVKSCSQPAKPYKKGISEYYYFHLTENQMRVCDFVICHAISQRAFYVIPIPILISNSIYIRTNRKYSHPTNAGLVEYYKKRKQRFVDYKEAWHLLS